MLASHLDLLTFLTLIYSIHKMFSIDFTSLKCTHYVYALKRFTKTNKYIEVSVFSFHKLSTTMKSAATTEHRPTVTKTCWVVSTCLSRKWTNPAVGLHF